MQNNIIGSLHLQFPKSLHFKSQVFNNVIFIPIIYSIASYPLVHLQVLKGIMVILLPSLLMRLLHQII